MLTLGTTLALIAALVVTLTVAEAVLHLLDERKPKPSSRHN